MKDPVKGNEWKSISKSVADEQSLESSVKKKRLPKKVRHIPDYYFLPRKSVPSAVAFYGSWILGGVGAGMLAEIWIDKKMKGIYITDFVYLLLIMIELIIQSYVNHVFVKLPALALCILLSN